MPCAVCNARHTIDAHVRSFEDFEDDEDDRLWNIITLCQLCHEEFDAEPGRIGIAPSKQSFLVLEDNGLVVISPTKVSIIHIKDEYVRWKNEMCDLNIRLALGLVLGYEHYRFVSL